jgi:hypothetical protein
MNDRVIGNPALPSKAALARKWPRLRINRLTGRWQDEASGKKGDDFQSLLAFIGEPTPRKVGSVSLSAANGADIGGRV